MRDCSSQSAAPWVVNLYFVSSQLNRNSNSTVGVWSIAVFNEATLRHLLVGEEHGITAGGIINSNGSVILRGETTFDGICTNQTHRSINITTDCVPTEGLTRTNIAFRGDNGEAGSFTGNVQCKT